MIHKLAAVTYTLSGAPTEEDMMSPIPLHYAFGHFDFVMLEFACTTTLTGGASSLVTAAGGSAATYTAVLETHLPVTLNSAVAAFTSGATITLTINQSEFVHVCGPFGQPIMAEYVTPLFTSTHTAGVYVITPTLWSR